MAKKNAITAVVSISGNAKGLAELVDKSDALKDAFARAKVEVGQTQKSLLNWSQGVQAIDAITNTVRNVKEAFSEFSATMRQQVQDNLQVTQLTGKTGEEMLRLRNAAKVTSEQFGTDFTDTMIGVNSLAKGFGISAEEALKLIQDGFVAGANANGEFVDTLKEYPRYFKEAGLSAEEFIAITTNAAQQGIYSDKGVDVIKEGNIRLREMTKATADALEGIGINAEAVQADLQEGSLTTFEVMQLVAGKLNELPASSAAVGTAIADIFGGPGEDAGLAYIQSLATVQTNMEAVKAAAGETAAQQAQQLATQEELKNSFLGLIDLSAIYTNVQPYVDFAAQIGTTALGVAGLVKTFKELNIAAATTRVRTLAVAASAKIAAAASAVWKGVQVALNFVLSANPIGLVVMAIGALVTAVIAAYNNCEGFRKVCDQVWAALKPLATAIMDGLAKAFEWLVEKCKEAWEWLKNILGLGGKKVEVAVNVTKPTNTNAPATNFGDKYNSTGGTGAGTTTGGYKPPKISAPAEAAAEEAATGLIGKLEAKVAQARKDLANATTEAAITALNESLAADEAELERLRNLGVKGGEAVATGVAEAVKVLDPSANTLKGISDNIEVLNKQLQTATIEQAAGLNQEIKLWQQKADEIRNAGKAAEDTGIKTEEALRGSWAGLKGIGGALTGIYESIIGTGSAWEKLTAIVDGFISLYDNFGKVLEIIKSVTALTTILTAAKQAETNANVKAAVSSALAANAGIPLVGAGIGAGAAASILAVMGSIPAFAAGGIVSGPTLAMVGEYGGASRNPEIIAPLDKLRGMLNPAGAVDLSTVEFRIKGRTLVGILDKEINMTKRS
jgi:hypothetical protein